MVDLAYSHPTDFFSDHKVLVQSIVDFVARKNGLSQAEKEDFSSEVYLKLLQDQSAVFRKFEGKSSIKTYLTVVISRFFLDYRDSLWGRWRPSTQAKRLGSVAMLLEQYTHRDGLSFDQAFQTLSHNHQLSISEVELLELYNQLPIRSERHVVGEETLVNHPSAEQPPDQQITQQLDQNQLEKAVEEVRICLKLLPESDQLILRLHFGKNLPLSLVAKSLQLDQKSLYRKVPKILGDLKTLLEQKGIHSSDLKALIG